MARRTSRTMHYRHNVIMANAATLAGTSSSRRREHRRIFRRPPVLPSDAKHIAAVFGLVKTRAYALTVGNHAKCYGLNTRNAAPQHIHEKQSTRFTTLFVYFFRAPQTLASIKPSARRHKALKKSKNSFASSRIQNVELSNECGLRNAD